MNITDTGYFIILITLISFMRGMDKLFKLLIFFIPFSATSVINIGSESSGSSVQPYMFISIFWLICSFFVGNNPLLDFKTSKTLLLFLFVALVSLTVPILIDGAERVNLTTRLDGFYSPLVFTSRHITQFLYLALGILISYTLAIYINSEERFLTLLKSYSLSILFVIAWGIFELFCKYQNIEYPSFIFNNSASESAKGYLATLESSAGSTLHRASSVGVEPSIIVQCVLLLFPFYNFKSKNYVIFSTKVDKLLAILMIFFIVLSTSTTGIVCVILAFWVKAFLDSTNTASFVARSVLIAAGLYLVVYAALTFFDSYFNSIFVNKLNSYSGMERLQNVEDSWRLFLKYPILGVGWSSVQSYDLFIKLLSNVGVIGTFVFLIFVVGELRKLFRARKESTWIECTFISFIVLLFSNTISGFSFVFGHTWLIVGMSMAFVNRVMTVPNFKIKSNF